MSLETQYLDLLNRCRYAPRRETRAGEARSLFGERLVCEDTADCFPILQTKEVHWPSVAKELLWFLSGDTNARTLAAQGVRIWNEWAAPDGSLGPVYGKQWRDFGGVDQIAELVESIETDPYGRRHLVSAWNPPEIPEMALPPCHLMAQFYVRGEYLDCQYYQRSADVFLGLPFNLASYALLLHLVANATGYLPGRLVATLGDVHLYENHDPQAAEQLKRPISLLKPALAIDAPVGTPPWGVRFEQLRLLGYSPAPKIRAAVNV